MIDSEEIDAWAKMFACRSNERFLISSFADNYREIMPLFQVGMDAYTANDFLRCYGAYAVFMERFPNFAEVCSFTPCDCSD